MKHLKRALFLFTLLALTVFAPLSAARVQAAAKYGPVTASWVKSGNISFQLKGGRLVYKVGNGKENVVATKVKGARYHGSKAAYLKAYKLTADDRTQRPYVTVPCGIYDCAAGKRVSSATIKSTLGTLSIDALKGFYNDTLVVSRGWGECNNLCLIKPAGGSCKEFGEICDDGAVQAGKSLIFIDNMNKDGQGDGPYYLKVLDMTTGRTKVISKKAWSVLVQGAKLIYAEAALNSYGGLKKNQTVRIYTCSFNGAGKKQLGSFNNGKSDWFYISLTKSAAFVHLLEENKYRMLKYGTNKLTSGTKAGFNKAAKQKGLVACGVTSIFD